MLIMKKYMHIRNKNEEEQGEELVLNSFWDIGCTFEEVLAV